MFEFSENDQMYREPSATGVGQCGEDMVARDLISREFYVFGPLVIHSPCDLIALKGGQTLRVEVKSSHKGKPVLGNPKHLHSNRYEILARVFIETGRIDYKPLPERFILQFDDQIPRCAYCGKDVTLDHTAGKNCCLGVVEWMCKECRINWNRG